MFDTLRKWRRQRVLRSAAIPDALWREALESLPFVAIYTDEELARLRAKVVLFLSAKSIVGARGHVVTPLQRVIIAIEACVLVLYLDLAYYDGWENVIVYPDEFIPGWEYEDEAGVVHRNDGPLAGESMPGGPVVLSWPDVEASADWDSAGMNLVIHEFAHKLDMRNGEANGCPPLPATMPPHVWKKTLTAAYDALPRARRARRGHGHRSVRGRIPRRVLRGALRGVLRRPDAAPARVCAGLQAAHVVLQAGPRLPDRAAARRVAAPPGRVVPSGTAMFADRFSSRRPTMKRRIALFAAALFAAGTAFAFHCPQDMKKIDDALAKNPNLTPAQMEQVKKDRAEGEALHKAGKHQESVDTLAKAMKTLGVN